MPPESADSLNFEETSTQTNMMTFRSQISALTEKNSELQNKIDEFSHVKRNLEGINLAYSREIELLKQKLQEKEDPRKTLVLRSLLSETNQKFCDAYDEGVQYKNDVEKLKDKLKKRKKRSKLKNRLVSDLIIENTRLKRELDYSTRALTNALNENTGLTTTVNEIDVQCQTLKGNVQGLRELISRVAVEINDTSTIGSPVESVYSGPNAKMDNPNMRLGIPLGDSSDFSQSSGTEF